MKINIVFVWKTCMHKQSLFTPSFLIGLKNDQMKQT